MAAPPSPQTKAACVPPLLGALQSTGHASSVPSPRQMDEHPSNQALCPRKIPAAGTQGRVSSRKCRPRHSLRTQDRGCGAGCVLGLCCCAVGTFSLFFPGVSSELDVWVCADGRRQAVKGHWELTVHQRHRFPQYSVRVVQFAEFTTSWPGGDSPRER